MPSLIWNALVGAFSILVKNPLVQKMGFFTIFLAVVYHVINYFIASFKLYIFGGSVFSVACQLGAIRAIQIYFSIILSGWGAKQVLAFIRS